MIGFLTCLIALGAPLLLARRSLGAALSAVAAIGYFYGIFRANTLESLSYFSLDAAFLGLYIPFFRGAYPGAQTNRQFNRTVRWLVGLLIGWPVVCILISPVLESQDILIQLVGLRATVFMVPMLLVGSQLERDDIEVLAVSVCILNLVTLVFALAEMRYGVEPFFPDNAVTQIIYISRDADSEMHSRIPSTFSNAHAYGATMLMTIPLALHLWELGRHRTIAALGVIASALGIFACAARQPVVMLGIGFVIFIVFNPPSTRMLVALVAALLGMGVIVASVERFQRFMTLSDTEMIAERVNGSLQMRFFDILFDYPMGRGLGSSTMTSVPYFLQYLLRPRIGLENEYSVIAIEQGVVGLGIWFGLVTLLIFRRNLHVPTLTRSAATLAWGIVIGLWCGAAIGAGMLATGASTLLFFSYMGILLRNRVADEVPASVTSSEHSPLRSISSTR